jgi:uncharacterized protein YbbC (DUF1343 family)
MTLSGLDVLQSEGFARLLGKRVGVIVNPTSVNARFEHLVDLLHATKNVTLSAIFGPEHGVRGEAQYMESFDSVPVDRATRVPVYSLYGSTLDSLTPKQQWLENLDVLVFDIQDVGSRYYTYVYTMALAMRAAARRGIPFVVLDRPNPLGLTRFEGNLPSAEYLSFVGLFPLPNRHGLTAGELARLFNTRDNIGCDLQVVACQGLARTYRWSDTALHFVSPSPNMPTVDTALVYPGMCLGEGTNVSEGRGTCRPFEQFGAPWLRGPAVAQALNALQLPGVVFRPCAFTPTFDKFRGVSCEGAFLHVVDAESFCATKTGIAVFQTCFTQSDGAFRWRSDAYEFVEHIPAFDLLCGTDVVRLAIEKGTALDMVDDLFESSRDTFRTQRESVALYQ